MIVSGKISVKAILQNRKRMIKRLIILNDKNDKESRYVEAIAKGVRIERMDRDAMDEIAGNTSHGGYVIECEARISDSMDAMPETKTLSLLCIEGVSDPFNLGEIIRTSASLGFNGLVTPEYDFYDSESKLIRASAGASESMWWFKSTDLASDLNTIKEKGVTVVAAYRGDESTALHHYTMPEKVCVCLGGALRGLSRRVLDLSDAHVRIDYDARVSLSTVGAASVFAYERFRQLED